MHLYCYIDSIKILPYPFTPHITLAYFNTESFGGEAIGQIEYIINQLISYIMN